MSSGTRLLIIFTFAVFIVLGAIASLALDSWWFLAVAVVVHALGTAIVLLVLAKRLQEEDKPDPVTEARLTNET
jgi:membrane protein implicated in regulation of membrane protease activity